ncbi:MAG: rhodanese-like domain-containing protein [Aureispira sp.]
MAITRFFCFYGLMLCFIIACAQSAGQELISWQDYEQMSQEQTDLQVVDVRTPEEFNAGSIESSVNIDFYADDFEVRLKQLDKKRPLVVYCKRGGRSNKTATRCKKLGFEKVYDIEGGYDQWKALQQEAKDK